MLQELNSTLHPTMRLIRLTVFIGIDFNQDKNSFIKIIVAAFSLNVNVEK